MDVANIGLDLAHALDSLQFELPVTHVYNPLLYADLPWKAYATRYGSTRREVLLVGMNPGPYGMVQTGVPFGAVPPVRDWLGIDAPVGQPPRVHPKRPVQGFACPRREVSGMRLWAWAATCGAPERFFARFFVYNYCPLAFMEESGKNRTPDKLPGSERAALYAVCDAALAEVVQALRPRYVLGIGAFAAARAQVALAGAAVRFGQILHPSPASPLAANDWGGKVTAQLATYGINLPVTRARTA